MNQKIKILYFVDRMLKGGIQSLLINWISNLNRDKFDIDVLLLDDGNKYELEDMLKALNCNVYKLEGIWIRKPSDFITYGKALDNFFIEHHDYKVIHLNSSSKNYQVLKYAKKYGIPIRIAHSHNTDFQANSKVKKIVGDVLKVKLVHYATDYFACSKIAGKWLFGRDIVKNSDKFKVIHNAIDYDKFKFDLESRSKIRKELNVKDNDLVLGCVARFEAQKNHIFLIDIFNEIHKEKPNSKLLLIGKGSLQNEVQEKVNELNLTDNVIFIGFKENVNEYLNAMDIFIMPSLYEGLGLVLIEAQANGLSTYTSKDVVPSETRISTQLQYVSLNENAKEWAEYILKQKNKRKDTYEEIKNAKYLLRDMINELEEIYAK